MKCEKEYLKITRMAWINPWLTKKREKEIPYVIRIFFANTSALSSKLKKKIKKRKSVRIRWKLIFPENSCALPLPASNVPKAITRILHRSTVARARTKWKKIRMQAVVTERLVLVVTKKKNIYIAPEWVRIRIQACMGGRTGDLFTHTLRNLVADCAKSPDSCSLPGSLTVANLLSPRSRR